MNPDIARWNQRYSKGDGAVEPKAEPEWAAQSKDSVFRRVPSGSDALGLDLACGKGGASLYLASIGYQMVAVDGAIEGLRICQGKAKALALPVWPVVMDLEAPQLAKSAFDIITVVRYLNRALFPALVEALAPGGTLFYKTFNTGHLKTNPRFNPDFVLQPAELETAFSELTLLSSEESSGSSYIICQKPV